MLSAGTKIAEKVLFSDTLGTKIPTVFITLVHRFATPSEVAAGLRMWMRPRVSCPRLIAAKWKAARLVS